MCPHFIVRVIARVRSGVAPYVMPKNAGAAAGTGGPAVKRQKAAGCAPPTHMPVPKSTPTPLAPPEPPAVAAPSAAAPSAAAPAAAAPAAAAPAAAAPANLIIPDVVEGAFETFVCTRIISDLQRADAWPALAGSDPVERAGVSPYSADHFTKSLTTDNVVECCLPLDYFAMWEYPHGNMGSPTIGAVLRVYDGVFKNASTSLPDPTGSMEPLLVAVRSPTDLPDRGGVRRLSLCALYFAFLYGWAEAVRLGDTALIADFLRVARSFRVRFYFMTSSDAIERMKWTTLTEQATVAENTSINGVRRAIAIAHVRDDHKNRKLPHTASAVSAWFKNARMDEELTPKVAERYLRIFARMSAVPGLIDALSAMESILGPRHTLIHSSHLDMLIGGTRCKDDALQNTLLDWVVMSIFVGHLRHQTPPLSREGLRFAMQAALFKRKVAQYLTTKFPFKAEADVSYISGRSPTEVLCACMSQTSFHELFPLGRPLIEVPIATDATTPTADQPWQCQLSECQLSIISFLKHLYDEHGALKGIVKSFLQVTPLGTPEAFLSRQDLKTGDIFDIVQVTTDYDTLMNPPIPPVETESHPEAPATESEPAAVVPSPTTPPLAPPAKNIGAFQILVFDDVIAELVNNVDEAKFNNMLDDARRRVATYLELRLRPGVPGGASTWAIALSDSLVARSACGKNRTLYVVTPNTCTERPGPHRPWRYLPAFPCDDVALIVKSIVGDPDLPDNPATFGSRNSSDMLVVSDGRRGDKYFEIKKLLKQCTAPRPEFPHNPVSTMRLAYTNKEFRRRSKLGNAGLWDRGAYLPDPVESLCIVVDKNFKLQIKQRRHLDLPGDNRTQMIQSVPFVPGDGDGHRVPLTPLIPNDKKAKALAGQLGTVASDDEDCGDDDEVVYTADQLSRTGIFSWSVCEMLHREFINMWDPTVSCYPYLGNGTEALAHVRSKIPLVAFGVSHAHLQFVREWCVASIIIEQLNGVDDGFRVRRFLTRVESLGGTSTASMAARTAAAPTPESEPAAAAGDSSARRGGGSVSSSSGSSEPDE